MLPALARTSKVRVRLRLRVRVGVRVRVRVCNPHPHPNPNPNQASSGRLVVLQRPSEAWAALDEGSEVRFTLNGAQLVCTLRVVRSASQEAIEAWKEAPPDAGLDGLLVLSEEDALLDD